VPELEGSWRYDAAARKVVVSVRQTQAADPYRLRLSIGLYAAGAALPRIVTADVTGREATLEFPADAEPSQVVLDPDVTVLAVLHPLTK
jgi:hypothetical protein